MKVTWRTLAVFAIPCVALYAMLVFVPIGVSLYYSFFQWNGIGEASWNGLSNYWNLLIHDKIFWPSLYRTLLFSLFSLAELPIALLIAIWLNRYVKRPNFLVSSYFLPVILSVVIIGQLWQAIYHPAMFGGLLNNLLIKVGLESWTRNWLSDPSTAIYAIYFVALWQYLGYHVLIQFTGVQNIPKEIYEAAKIDGASGWKLDRYITVPLTTPIFKISVILAVIGSLKAFDTIMVMTAGGPAHATEVVSTYMYNKAFMSLEYGYASAISVILVLECLAATVLLNLLFKKSEANLQ